MPLIYDGFLQAQVSLWISSATKDYSHSIEMISLPENWVEWCDENLADYEVVAENCQGQFYDNGVVGGVSDVAPPYAPLASGGADAP
jgi:hypothetical protein